jgi:hypothetical protein
VGDRQFVTWCQSSSHDTSAVDPDTIGTAQVEDHDVPIREFQTAVTPGDSERLEADVARRMTAHNDRRTVQDDVRTFVKGQ